MKKNYFYYLCFCAFALLFSTALWAQKASITGVITDVNKEPLPGVTVRIENSATNALTGTTTDLDGKYEILGLEKGEYVLTFSYIGYITEIRTANVNQGAIQKLDISLNEDNKLLNEVVVVGYGTQRKRELVGNVAKIEAKDIVPTVGGTFDAALQGKAAGVQVVQNSGAAGAGTVVRIRGIGSVSSGGDPLYVVDGMPITQDYFLNGESNGANNNPLNSINPNDIESIEVLKDAAAAAIYGSRGANGVILITTKRGKGSTGKPQFTFRSAWGLSEPTKVLPLLNAQEWLQILQEAWENDGGVGRAPLPQNLTYEQIEGINTNWYDYVLQTGVKQEYNIGMQQGNQKLRTYIGLGYSDSESFLKNNSFQRVSGRANIDWNPVSRLQVSVSTSLARGLNRRVAEAWAGGLGMAQTSALPIYPVYSGDFAGAPDTNAYFNLYGNPVAQSELQRNRVVEWRSLSNLSLTYKFTDRWDLTVAGLYDYMNLGNYTHEQQLWTGTYDIAKGSKKRTYNYLAQAYTNYDVPLNNDKHSLKLMLGTEYQGRNGDALDMEFRDLRGQIYESPEQGEAFDTTRYELNDRLVDKWIFLSGFGRINYAFNNKWLVQGVLRYDGSSKFGPNNRFGLFPSIGFGYIMSEEPFLKDSETVNFLKFKASFGLTGNADINWTEQFATFRYTQTGYNGQPFRYQDHIENPDLRWENVRTFDAGFEVGLWDDRLTLDASYYNRTTLDAILNAALQATTGIENANLSYFVNIGKIRNTGVELGLVTHNIVGAFRWTTRINAAHNKNEVLSVGTATPDALDGGFGDTRAVVGYPVNTNYLVLFSHVDPATGRPVYLDKDGNETFLYDVVNNRQPAGDANPRWVGGITNTFSYKGFSLNCLFNFSAGGKVYDDAAKRQLGVVTDWNMRREVINRWQEPGDISNVPRLTTTMLNWGGNANFWQNNHSLWLEDASFLRLRTLELSYQVPLKSNKAVRGLRIVLSGTNLLTWTNYTGWDPEVTRGRENAQQRNIGGTNVTYLVAPQEKTYNLGLTLEF